MEASFVATTAACFKKQQLTMSLTITITITIITFDNNHTSLKAYCLNLSSCVAAEAAQQWQQ
jgi:hypothetical protein